jgi:hypothetical protein
MTENNNELAWSQFCKLGEMIGDGLHYEEPWISKEYNRLRKILLPETKEEKEYKRNATKIKNERINNQIVEKLKVDRCSCGAELKQIRSGSKKVKCSSCDKRYKYGTKK